MKIKFNWMNFVTGLTVLLITYSTLFFLDQTHQARVITDFRQLEAKENIHTDQAEHLRQLGFSNIMITHMTLSEQEQYKDYQGKIVGEETIYRKISGERDIPLTKNQYFHLLKSYSQSKWLHSSSLERVDLKLVSVGKDGLDNNKYLAITEHHFDYTPHNLIPMQIELQLGDNFNIQQTAKQIWWTTSSWDTKKLHSGVNNVASSLSPPEGNEAISFLGGSRNSQFLSVHWKQPSLLEDIVGLHFYTITEFSSPSDQSFTNVFIQGQHPHLSKQIQNGYFN